MVVSSLHIGKNEAQQVVYKAEGRSLGKTPCPVADSDNRNSHPY